MNRLPFRVAAVCFSMLMVSGYVFLRAAGGAKVMPGSKSARVAAPGESSAATGALLPGSKSDVLILQSTTQPVGEFTLNPGSPTEPQKRAIFYGSKSAPVALPGESLGLQFTPTTQPVSRIMIQSNGSGRLFKVPSFQAYSVPPNGSLSLATTQPAFALPAPTLPTQTIDSLLPPGVKSSESSGQGQLLITGVRTTQPATRPAAPNQPPPAKP